MLLKFPGHRVRHGRASAGSGTTRGRAASVVIISAVTPASRATPVARIAAHHSDGILSRRRHLETIEYVAPMSDTAASIEGHRSITALNEFGLDIESLLGQFGLYGKANVAHDGEDGPGENVAMADRSTETKEKYAFIRRVKQARMARFTTQTPICTILGIAQGTYKHYETRSTLPHRFIPKFIAATGAKYEWLLAGEGKAPVPLEAARDVPKRTSRSPRTKVA